jgi:hypothetical protein
MKNKINIVVDLPYELDVEIPEGKTIQDVLGLFFGNGEWELKYKEKDNEEFSSIFVNPNDFKRMGKIISGTEFYDYESKESFSQKDLHNNIFPGSKEIPKKLCQRP